MKRPSSCARLSWVSSALKRRYWGSASACAASPRSWPTRLRLGQRFGSRERLRRRPFGSTGSSQAQPPSAASVSVSVTLSISATARAGARSGDEFSRHIGPPCEEWAPSARSRRPATPASPAGLACSRLAMTTCMSLIDRTKAGDARAACSACARRSVNSRGVPRGANSPCQMDSSSPRMPASATVGSARHARQPAAHWSRRARGCGRRGSVRRYWWSGRTSGRPGCPEGPAGPGPVPRYGTWIRSTSRDSDNSRPHRCEAAPSPA